MPSFDAKLSLLAQKALSGTRVATRCWPPPPRPHTASKERLLYATSASRGIADQAARPTRTMTPSRVSDIDVTCINAHAQDQQSFVNRCKAFAP